MAAGKSRESARMALDTLRTNKMRSGLTILGIVIGVATVITLSSFINGLNRNIETWVSAFGTNVYWVFRFPVINVRRTPEMLARKQLTLENAASLEHLPHVIAVSPQLQYTDYSLGLGKVSVKYKDRKVQHTMLEGDTVAEPQVDSIDIPVGRFYSPYEQNTHANVVILGHDTAEQLFRGEDPLGKEVEIDGDEFRVIGVMDKRKTAFGSGNNPADNSALFPMGTFQKIHPEEKDVWISVKYDDPKNKAAVYDEIEQTLRIQRKEHFNQADNFAIFEPDALTRLWNQLTSGIFLFMIGVASVGLMVGGVGVMNIMLVSVTERTRRDWRAQGHWSDQTQYSAAIHHRGNYAVRCRRRYRRYRRRAADAGRPAGCAQHSRLRLHLLGHYGIQRLLRHWAHFWHLSSMEGGEPRSHRRTAI